VANSRTNVRPDWLVHLLDGGGGGAELVGEGTRDDGLQVSIAPSRHTGFTVVNLFYISAPCCWYHRLVVDRKWKIETDTWLMAFSVLKRIARVGHGLNIVCHD
jgi:hypothetical protein